VSHKEFHPKRALGRIEVTQNQSNFLTSWRALLDRFPLLARALFGRRWWWVTLLVALLAGAFVRLGVWQLDRLEQRRAANTGLEQALAAPPIDLNRAVLTEDSSAWANHSVVATGQYDYDQQLILKLQSWQGRPGVHLVTPLVLTREQGSGGAGGQAKRMAVLVDRGWIPDEEVGNGDLVQFAQPGETTVAGYIALSQTMLRQPDSVSAPRGAEREIFRVNVNAIAPTVPYELLPFYVIETPPAGETTTLPYNQPRQVDLSEGPHLSYAIQWFLFSLILVGGYFAYVNRRIT
jgi:surfeit locus 1 family protein